MRTIKHQFLMYSVDLYKTTAQTKKHQLNYQMEEEH